MLRGIAVDAGVNPVIKLLKQEATGWIELAANDEWETDTRAAQVGALPANLHLPDRNGNDAGLLRDLEAGVYTLRLSSGAGTGAAVVGVDAVDDFGPELINISTRAYISSDDNAFAGFIINGSGTVMLRGIAVDAGVNPVIKLLKQEAAGWVELAANDEWETDTRAAWVGALPASLHLPDRNGNDAGLLRDLEPGVYTLQLGTGADPGKAVVGVDWVE